MDIARKFYHTDEETPVANTVGELAELLKELPPELPIETTWNSGVQISVYNFGESNCHLEFEKIDR